ncbi:MAG: nuclear transport factor 2 family protein [Caulobacter sp.]|nr:nuclear transport factor 2 family protein [Caulobacter sp.]
MADGEAVVTRLWEALNGQDLEAASALLHPDVDWQDIMNGGRQRGRDTVLAYWREVFDVLRPDSTVMEFLPQDDGRLSARTLHHVRDPDGRLRVEEVITHLFGFKDGMIVSMDVA